MRTYKARPIIPGHVKGEAIVSKQGVNWLATFQESIIKGKKKAVGGDRNNPYIYRKVLTDKIMVIPLGIGSTTGSVVLVEAIIRGIAPKAVICAKETDTLTATGALLAYHWFNKRMILLDKAGDSILDEVETGSTIEIDSDGTIKVL